jgi:hypothetical protein
MSRSKSTRRMGAAALLSAMLLRPGAAGAERLNDKQLEALLRETETAAEGFRQAARDGLERVVFPAEPLPQLAQMAADLEISIRRLHRSAEDGRAPEADVREVLNRAVPIEDFMRRYPLVSGADVAWLGLRGRLDLLAGAFGVGWKSGAIEGSPARVRDRELRGLLARLEDDVGRFEKELDRGLAVEHGFEAPLRRNIERAIEDFAGAVEALRDRVDGDLLVGGEVERMRDLMAAIARFAAKHPFPGAVQSSWGLVEDQVEEVARIFGLAPAE